MSLTPRLERLIARRHDEILAGLCDLLATERRRFTAKRWLLRLEGALT